MAEGLGAGELPPWCSSRCRAAVRIALLRPMLRLRDGGRSPEALARSSTGSGVESRIESRVESSCPRDHCRA